MSEQWYYVRDNKRTGPVSAAELTRLISGGQLSPTVLVWKDGLANWVQANQIKTLVPVSERPGAPRMVAERTTKAQAAETQRMPSGPSKERVPWALVIPVSALAVAILTVMIVVGVIKSRSWGVAASDKPNEQQSDKQNSKQSDQQTPAKFDVQVQDEPDVDHSEPSITIDKTPFVKYALRSADGRQPPFEFQDESKGPDDPMQLPSIGKIPPPANLLSFGVRATDAAETARNKLLTWAANGQSGSTVVRIDGAISELGSKPGKLVRFAESFLAEGVEPTPDASSPTQSTWVVSGDAAGNGGLRFHQVLEVVPGQADGVSRRHLDTVLVRWLIDNQDWRPHRVGLRIQLDTLIGNNDGVPFTVPGRSGLVSTSADFAPPQEVPDFVQALEIPNLQSPGTVVHLTAKVGGKLEPPDRLSLTCQQFWGFGFDPAKSWDFPIESMRNDSAIILYWLDKELAAGAKRQIGFAYGLGNVTTATDSQIALTLGGTFEPGKNLTIAAYVKNPQSGQTLTLELPSGLERVGGDATQTVPALPGAQDTGLVTWKAKVLRDGEFPIRVRSSRGATIEKVLRIGAGATGKFGLQLVGKIALKEDFLVQANVSDPRFDQKLTLTLPKEIELVEGSLVQPAANLVTWKVRIVAAGRHRIAVASSTGLTKAKTVTISGSGP